MGTKISELTSGTAANTDQIPVNQNGTTKRVTALAVAQLAQSTASSASDDTETISLLTGAITGNVAKNSGTLNLRTGDTSSTNSNAGTGGIILATGSRTANSAGPGAPGEGLSSGVVALGTGATKNEFSGNIQLSTGQSEWQSGDIILFTGDGLIDDDAYSGEVFLKTGAASGTAECGDIHISPGINSDTPSVNGRVIIDSLTRLYVAADDPTGQIEGDVYYNSTSHKIKFYDGSAWRTVTST